MDNLLELKAEKLKPIGDGKINFGVFVHVESDKQCAIVSPEAAMTDGSKVVIIEPINEHKVVVVPESEFRAQYAKVGPDFNRYWPTEGEKFNNVMVAVVPNDDGTMACVIDAPDEVNSVLSDDGMVMDRPTFNKDEIPTEVGLYRLTLEYWFEQGYFEGHPADGESEWGFNIVQCERITP